MIDQLAPSVAEHTQFEQESGAGKTDPDQVRPIV